MKLPWPWKMTARILERANLAAVFAAAPALESGASGRASELGALYGLPSKSLSCLYFRPW